MLKKITIFVFMMHTFLNTQAQDTIRGSFKPLETNRLIIRAIEQSDTEDCFALFSVKELGAMMASFPFHANIEQTIQFVNDTQLDYTQNIFAWLAVIEKSSNKMVGMVGFDDYAPKYCRAGIAYVFAKEFWGKGYAFEASKKLVNFGFEVMNLNRIYATVDPENLRSAHVLEKLGMQYEGYLRHMVRCQGKFCDRKIYAILKSDWQTLENTEKK